MYLLVSADDILAVDDRRATEDAKQELAGLFKAKDLGACTHYL